MHFHLVGTCVIGTLLLAVGGSATAQGQEERREFQRDPVGGVPSGFSFARTGGGRPGKWTIRVDPSAPDGDRVLAQVDADDTDYRFPIAVADAPVLKDVRAEVRCKQVSGRTDEACGLVFRYLDQDNYYVARANALEDNVRLYRVVRGDRQQLGGWNGKVAGQVWHRLGIEARGDHLRVSFDGQPVIEATDGTFRGAGKVGVWTKADSITYFDGLTVSPAEPGAK